MEYSSMETRLSGNEKLDLSSSTMTINPPAYPTQVPVFATAPYSDPAGQLYYPQQGVMYHGSQLPPGQPPQQQVIVMGNNQPMQPATIVVARTQNVSMMAAFILSCFAFWCCGWLFGGIAFVLAMIGHNAASIGDNEGAIRLRNASYGLSIAGIFIGALAIIVTVVVIVTTTDNAADDKPYYQANNCYKYYDGTTYSYICK